MIVLQEDLKKRRKFNNINEASSNFRKFNSMDYKTFGGANKSKDGRYPLISEVEDGDEEFTIIIEPDDGETGKFVVYVVNEFVSRYRIFNNEAAALDVAEELAELTPKAIDYKTRKWKG